MDVGYYDTTDISKLILGEAWDAYLSFTDMSSDKVPQSFSLHSLYPLHAAIANKCHTHISPVISALRPPPLDCLSDSVLE